MLSRIADSLFWLNRYMERADGLLRTTKTNYILLLDKGVNDTISWKPVLEIFTYEDSNRIAQLEHDTNAVLKLIMTDTTNINSLKVIITRARENARGIQDNITKEVWEQVNHMYHMFSQPDLEKKLNGYEALGTIESFEKSSLLFTGVTDITMPRGMGWNFMNLGKLVERCIQTIEMTDKRLAAANYSLESNTDILFWRNLLLALSGYELHLKTYRSNNATKDVLHQVLINPHFTRSVIYTLTRINRYLKNVIEENPKVGDNMKLENYYGRFYSKIKYLDFENINDLNLQQFLKEIRSDLLDFSNKLAKCFFSYS